MPHGLCAEIQALQNPASPATYGTSTFTETTPTFENWIGTTDANDLTFGTNSIERMRIKQTTGAIGIGIAAPTSLLHIYDAKTALCNNLPCYH